eukprot:6819793-Alexandrium_andersonii.AAC.1
MKPHGLASPDISLEGYAAFAWSREARGVRPDEPGCGRVHLDDNATQVGARAKGRSSSHRIN